MEKYDLIVIGSGPAGQRAAIQAAKFGKRVRWWKSGSCRGTAINTGTIPSKTIRERCCISLASITKTFTA